MAVKYLTKEQVEILSKAAKKTRNPVRNQLIIMLMYRHGLRVSELCEMRRDHVRLEQALIDVKRLKGSIDSSQPMQIDETRLMRRYLAERGDISSPWLFITERGGPFNRGGINYILAELGKKTGIKVCPKMMRHGCGFYLADIGTDIRVIQAYLGHANIQNTVIYTQLTGKQFEQIKF